MPVYMQFGYNTQAHMDLDRWGVIGCQGRVGGRLNLRAEAALNLKAELEREVELARVLPQEKSKPRNFDRIRKFFLGR